MNPIKIGIIGGSGLSNPNILEGAKEHWVDTPFGKPSDALLEGKIEGTPCVLLARHGRKHSIMPSKVNYRANLWALKEQGCTHLVVSTACGSLQNDIQPGHFVILDQFIDRTTKRHQTFYDGEEGHPSGILHIPMDSPFCPETRMILAECCKELDFPVHLTGTMVTIEGPRFSSKAESHMFRQWGGHVVNMTTVPEVVLARELGMFYATIAMATDYDCWKDTKPVSVDQVLTTFKLNSEKAIKVLKLAVTKIAAKDWTDHISALQKSVKDNIMLPQ